MLSGESQVNYQIDYQIGNILNESNVKDNCLNMIHLLMDF
jgi:hypothetical protein